HAVEHLVGVAGEVGSGRPGPPPTSRRCCNRVKAATDHADTNDADHAERDADGAHADTRPTSVARWVEREPEPDDDRRGEAGAGRDGTGRRRRARRSLRTAALSAAPGDERHDG